MTKTFGKRVIVLMMLLLPCGLPKNIAVGQAAGIGSASAIVKEPVIGSVTKPLKFGLIWPGGRKGGGGVVVVTPKNRRFARGGVRLGRCGHDDHKDKDKDKDKDDDKGKDKDDDKDRHRSEIFDRHKSLRGYERYASNGDFFGPRYDKDKDHDRHRPCGRHSRAVFDLSGVPNTFFGINLSSSPAHHIAGGRSHQGRHSGRHKRNLQITNLKSFSVTQRTNTPTGKFNSRGKETIWVGGSLRVPARAKKGSYTGKITLTVNF
jgi:hypothetical protein